MKRNLILWWCYNVHSLFCRYCAKPHEYIVQCAPFAKDELSKVLEDIICTRQAFLHNHRYDPFEIYSDEFMEELKGTY